MTETGQVKAAVVERLEAAGLTAISAFEEERMRRHASSAVVVGVRQMRIEQMGLIDYLGEICEADGSHTEVYGREMKLQLSVDVYTPRELGAGESERTAEAAAQALMAALPGGTTASGSVIEAASQGARAMAHIQSLAAGLIAQW